MKILFDWRRLAGACFLIVGILVLARADAASDFILLAGGSASVLISIDMLISRNGDFK